VIGVRRGVLFDETFKASLPDVVLSQLTAATGRNHPRVP